MPGPVLVPTKLPLPWRPPPTARIGKLERGRFLLGERLRELWLEWWRGEYGGGQNAPGDTRERDDNVWLGCFCVLRHASIKCFYLCVCCVFLCVRVCVHLIAFVRWIVVCLFFYAGVPTGGAIHRGVTAAPISHGAFATDNPSNPQPHATPGAGSTGINVDVAGDRKHGKESRHRSPTPRTPFPLTHLAPPDLIPNVALFSPPVAAATAAAFPALARMDESMADAGDMQRLPVSGEAHRPMPPRRCRSGRPVAAAASFAGREEADEEDRERNALAVDEVPLKLLVSTGPRRRHGGRRQRRQRRRRLGIQRGVCTSID